MSKILRSPGLARFLLLTGVGFATFGSSLSTFVAGVAHGRTAQDFGGQEPAGQDIPDVNPFGQQPDDDQMPRRGLRKAVRKKSASATKLAPKNASGSARSKSVAAKKGATDASRLTFAQDVAPILVANCIGCHSGEGAGIRLGKLDLSTFENLKKGSLKRTDDREVVIAGKPDDSHLVLRIKGDEEPRMPQGGNNRLADEAIAKISQWVKEGATLDEGLDPTKPIKSYAATPEQVARRQIARLPVQERDKKAEAAGLELWKRANPKLEPKIERGDQFLMFSNLSSDRAKTTLKAMDKQYGHLKALLGSPMMDWEEKLSLYVFSTRKDFIEFVRTIEQREVEPDSLSSAKFLIPEPYLAVVDPAGGKKDEPAAAKRKGRSKRSESKDGDGGSGDRSLVGVLTEALGTNVVAANGTAPRWLALGLGTYLASRIERGSPYYDHLRQTAFAEFSQGWKTKALAALGATDIGSDSLHAIGFALVESMMSEMNQGFPSFVQGMLLGGEKLDDTLKDVYGGTREEFIEGTGEWVASHYGRLE